MVSRLNMAVLGEAPENPFLRDASSHSVHACVSGPPRGLLAESHPYLLAADVAPEGPLHFPLNGAALWKFCFHTPEAAKVGPLQRDTDLIALTINGIPRGHTVATYVTPSRYDCAAQTREDLALTYGPGFRFRVPPQRTAPFSL